jgi:hypothetical protein
MLVLFLNASRDSFLLVTNHSLLLQGHILFFLCFFSKFLCSHLIPHSFLIVTSCFFELSFFLLLLRPFVHSFHLLILNSLFLKHVFFFTSYVIFSFS